MEVDRGVKGVVVVVVVVVSRQEKNIKGSIVGEGVEAEAMGGGGIGGVGRKCWRRYIEVKEWDGGYE